MFFSTGRASVFVYDSLQGKKQYAEKLFTSFQLSSYVPQDNFYRRLKDTLDLHWLYKATEKYYGSVDSFCTAGLQVTKVIRRGCCCVMTVVLCKTVVGKQ